MQYLISVQLPLTNNNNPLICIFTSYVHFIEEMNEFVNKRIRIRGKVHKKLTLKGESSFSVQCFRNQRGNYDGFIGFKTLHYERGH